MAVTLAQTKLNALDDVQTFVIDEFRKSSAILDAMTFDDVVNPAGGGSTLTYGYTRLTTEVDAAFRALNAEYTPAEAAKTRYTVDLKVLGGSFQIDRVLADVARGAETALQMAQKIKAATARFSDTVVNGDTGVDANSFDGLSKSLTGSSTEYLPLNNGVSTGYLDWTGTGITDTNKANDALDHLDAFLHLLNDEPTMLLGNTKTLTRVRSLARRAGYFVQDRNEFGQGVEMYGNIMLVDPGNKPASSSPIIPIRSADTDGAGAGGTITGLADLYAVRFSLDGFHGVSAAGQPLVKAWLPDFTTAGAVKNGEVELGPVAVALKATKSAGVLRNIKVQ